MTDDSTQDTPDTGVSAGQQGSAAEPADQNPTPLESTQDGDQTDTDTAATEDSEDGTDWKAEAEKWRALARKHETNAKGARQAREELDELRETVAKNDVAAVEAASSLASERLHTRLARAGMSQQDAESLVEHIDPMRLIENGKPSPKALDAVAASLARSLGRGSVDADQGQRSDAPQVSADDWLRRKARK